MSATKNKEKTGDRRRAREIALQVLFQREFVADVDVATSLSYFKETVTASPAAWSFAETLLNGVLEHRNAIDSQISEKSRGWKIERMSAVDLSILRVAAFEIMFGAAHSPPKVAIDEAIEIAKKYASTDSSGFINGILDSILSSQK